MDNKIKDGVNCRYLGYNLEDAIHDLALARVRAREDCIIEEENLISCFEALQDAVKVDREQHAAFFAKIDEMLAETFAFQQSAK